MAIPGDVTIGEIPAHFVRPEGEGPFPIVLVVHEIFGVHEHIRDICRRLAAFGYLAIAPNLYARQGDVSKIQDNKEINERVVSRVPDAQVMSDLDAVARWAAEHAQGDPERLFVTGFCWGGRITWLYAAHSSKLKAGVAWYGKITPPATPLQPRTPLDAARELKCPVLGLYGGRDASIPLDGVEQMRAASGAEIVVYPEAGHGFFADYRPSYNPQAAADGWQRLQNFLRQHGA